MLIIGSHVSFTSKNQLLGSAKEALSYKSNTFMIYTGAPQNTRRSEINDDLTRQADKLMQENGINKDNLIVHAPYIVNLANNKIEEKYQFSIEFLKKEVARCIKLGIKHLVLHPGNAVGIDLDVAIFNIANGLNNILSKDDDIIILLETMAGKGTEIGRNLNELSQILDQVVLKDKIGFCLDTCHLSDSGLDITNFDKYLDEFDKVLGIDKIKCIHVNDSKNDIGASKDRHENIGFGEIGFDNLINVIYNKRLESVPKILETPYIGKNAPYKEEIKMIREKSFNKNLKEEVLSND